MTKRIKRKALAIVTQGITSRGNPRYYWYLLECGHTLLNFHNANNFLDLFLMKKSFRVLKVCRNCSSRSDKPIDFERIKRLFGSSFEKLIKIKLELECEK